MRINRFRIAMTVVVGLQTAVSGGLAAATQLNYAIPPWMAIGGAMCSLFLGVLAAQMPSWQAAPEVAKAATAAETP